ncbi:MAG: endo-polygalacturonase [Bacteroidales bacterium]|nr:endo-polygalacturonase [Bacteroidales bacterium]
MRKVLSILLLACLAFSLEAAPKVPFQVRYGKKKATVYPLKVSPKDSLLRMRGMDDKKGSAAIFEMAAFCSFDIEEPTCVTVKVRHNIGSAKVLPYSRGIVPEIKGKELRFEARPGDRLTVEIDGDEYHSLHIFANAPETEVYSADDPNVIYYGPGEHTVSRIVVRSGQTLYLAPGAVLYGEMFQREKGGAYSPVISLIGDNIKVRGRGIVDGSLCETLSTNLLFVNGKNISIEGIILRDASVWTLPVKNSENVDINGVKILGYRANSDGVDICNSRNVIVRNCFIRTLDDLIVVKTTQGGGPTENVHAYGNVLWNEVAHAVSVGAEIVKDITGVVFEDNDIIHDKGREWSIRVYHCDQARVSGIVFRNLRIEESNQLISMWINKAVWSSSSERGHIDGVLIQNVDARRVVHPVIQMLGYDADHRVENVTLENVSIDGRPVTQKDLTVNEFVNNINVK